MSHTPIHARARRRGRTAAAIVAGAVLALGVAAGPASAADLNIVGGSSSGSSVPNGSYLQLTGGGTPITNADSQNTLDKTYTWLTPGTAGGLNLGSYQSTGAILASKLFVGATFSPYTTSSDPAGIKTGTFPSPALTFSGGALTSGDLRSWTIAYNAHSPADLYNQGAQTGGSTVDHDLTGTETAVLAGNDYTLDWSSQINGAYAGDPFNGAVGHWHLAATDY